MATEEVTVAAAAATMIEVRRFEDLFWIVLESLFHQLLLFVAGGSYSRGGGGGGYGGYDDRGKNDCRLFGAVLVCCRSQY